MHLREDRRHVQDRDAEIVRQVIQVKLNLEMAMTEAMLRYAIKLKPDQVTLVPEKRLELTTEGGLDCVKYQRRLVSATRRLRGKGISVSAFIVPAKEQVEACTKAGCDAIELHTGMYANAKTDRQIAKRLTDLKKAKEFAHDSGLIVHAGHGLNYQNIIPVAKIDGWADFNIGHSIISRAVLVGLERAVREMKALVSTPSSLI